MRDQTKAETDTARHEAQLCISGEKLTLLAEGAVWWAARRTLIVSDLHLEKGSSYARQGQFLPPYDTRATLDRVERLMQRLAPDCVISLGDSFHDASAERRLAPDDRARIRTLTGQTDWLWIEGNHDPDPPAHLGGRARSSLSRDGLIFRHEPTGQAGEIAGHLHPCARIANRVRTLRKPCFVTDGCRLILPAMGAFTGGLNVCDPAFDVCFPDGKTAVFALSNAHIVAIAPRRLIGDTVRGPSGRWRIAATS